jgi:DNA polymerase III subunit epsilon
VPVPDTFVLLDLETTGANPVSDRITEIAAIRVERGEIVERWETLVNPGRPIPAFIQQIIGITDDMVRDAPAFAELAPRVRALLDGAVFVAHNARFDYGFIHNEFGRLGEDFDAPVMCTVKLSRALQPEHHRHGLDALIERHGFVCDARHRAMGDADVLWQFLQLAREKFPAAALEAAWDKAMKFPARPPKLPAGILEGLPDAPGVYLFFGEEDEVLFVGRSPALRARVMEHFAAIERKGKEGDLARAVRRLEWIETAGELTAALLELDLQTRLAPRHNRSSTPAVGACGLRVNLRRRGVPQIQRVALDGTDPADWQDIYGAFRGKKEADAMLHELTGAYGLCPRRLGLEAAGSGACAARKAGRCVGVCAGRETPEAHDERLLGALAGVGVRPWPWGGPVVVTERSAHTDAVSHLVFDRWCHLGSADSSVALAALLAAPPPRAFSLDLWRLFSRWLAQPGNETRVEAV